MSYLRATVAGMTGQAATVSVTIMDQSGAGRVAATITLDDVDSRITLRDLIRTRVRDEVARYNARPAGTGVFQGLVMPDGAAPVPGGFLMPKSRRIDWEQQADQALESFRRNGFFVLVADEQVTDLDAALELTADTDIRFIRLVQLVGG